MQGRGRRTPASGRSPKVCAETVKAAPLAFQESSPHAFITLPANSGAGVSATWACVTGSTWSRIAWSTRTGISGTSGTVMGRSSGSTVHRAAWARISATTRASVCRTSRSSVAGPPRASVRRPTWTAIGPSPWTVVTRSPRPSVPYAVAWVLCDCDATADQCHFENNSGHCHGHYFHGLPPRRLKQIRRPDGRHPRSIAPAPAKRDLSR